MDALGLGYILPTAGRIRVFHPLERALTGRTSKRVYLVNLNTHVYFSQAINPYPPFNTWGVYDTASIGRYPLYC